MKSPFLVVLGITLICKDRLSVSTTTMVPDLLSGGFSIEVSGSRDNLDTHSGDTSRELYGYQYPEFEEMHAVLDANI